MLSSGVRLVPRKVQLNHSLICTSRSFMDLKTLISSLNDFASLSFAESWDNVGLLVEPSPPHTVNTLFLTNDLTEEVMEEALQKKADLILSYHPPVFRPLKRITWNTWKERLVIRALENRVGIYSPHTAYDAAPQGVNSWLAKGLGACTSHPIHPSKAPNYPTEGTHRVEFSVNHAQDLDKVISAVKGIKDVSVTSFSARSDDEEQTRVSLNCTQEALLQVVVFLSQNKQLYQKTEILSLEKPLLLHTGMGRLCTLDESVSLATMVERIKRHLKLSHVRLSLGVGRTLGKYTSFILPVYPLITLGKGETFGYINVRDRKHASSSWEMIGLLYRLGWARLCCGIHLNGLNHKIYFSVTLHVHLKSAGEVWLLIINWSLLQREKEF
ncbi:NIF3-like protein 1 isoform 1-T1 [Trichechus inunguis]